jgi:hypothetical protein
MKDKKLRGALLDWSPMKKFTAVKYKVMKKLCDRPKYRWYWCKWIDRN